MVTAGAIANMQKQVSKRTELRMRDPAKDLAARILNRTIRVGIIGMGYVGLPLMLASVAKNIRVLGFDIDKEKVSALNKGKSPLKHFSDAKVAAACRDRLFEATIDMNRLSEVDIIIMRAHASRSAPGT